MLYKVAKANLSLLWLFLNQNLKFICSKNCDGHIVFGLQTVNAKVPIVDEYADNSIWKPQKSINESIKQGGTAPCQFSFQRHERPHHDFFVPTLPENYIFHKCGSTPPSLGNWLQVGVILSSTQTST